MNGSIRPDGKFMMDVYVPCCDADASLRLRPTAFMNYAQEIAHNSADASGFGYNLLKPQGWAWVLSRFHFRYSGDPVWRDNLKLYSWHKGPSGPFFLRDFQLVGEDGRTLVSGTSSWVVMDLVNRCMVRPDKFAASMPEHCTIPDHAIAEPAPKVMMPRDVEVQNVGVHKVAYSDVDLNNHTNNVKYLEWALDSLDFETASRPVRDVNITFSHETHAGEEICLHQALRTETDRLGGSVDAFYCEGLCQDGKQAFITRVEF